MLIGNYQGASNSNPRSFREHNVPYPRSTRRALIESVLIGNARGRISRISAARRSPLRNPRLSCVSALAKHRTTHSDSLDHHPLSPAPSYGTRSILS